MNAHGGALSAVETFRDFRLVGMAGITRFNLEIEKPTAVRTPNPIFTPRSTISQTKQAHATDSGFRRGAISILAILGGGGAAAVSFSELQDYYAGEAGKNFVGGTCRVTAVAHSNVMTFAHSETGGHYTSSSSSKAVVCIDKYTYSFEWLGTGGAPELRGVALTTSESLRRTSIGTCTLPGALPEPATLVASPDPVRCWAAKTGSEEVIARFYPKCDTVPACVKLLGSPKADFEARTREPSELLLYLFLSVVAFLGGTFSACSAMASAPPETFAPPLSARARERRNSKDLM